jgi:hypothetical protein
MSSNHADHFDSLFPAPSETFLSRIVARQVYVRMRNLDTNAIQDITPRFADLLLYFLHAKIRRLPSHMIPNMNEGTLKKFSTRMSSAKQNGRGGGEHEAAPFMINLYMSQVKSSRKVSMQQSFEKMNSCVLARKKTSLTYCALEPKGCRTKDVSSEGAW